MSDTDSTPGLSYKIAVNTELAGLSVRSVVQRHLHLSRRMLRQLAANNSIHKNDEVAYLTSATQVGDIIYVMLPVELSELEPESVELDIRYEDHETLVVNKAAGMLTHPTARERDGSLLQAAYAHIAPQVPHCVHRLDRETSGLVMLAKHGHFHHLFDETLRKGRIHRVYCGFIHLDDEPSYAGEMDWETIDLPIAQDPNAPSRRIISGTGQRAVTHYRVLSAEDGVGVALVVLETGRTHQIRLHFAAVGQPLLGDPVYGRRTESAGARPVLSPARRSDTTAATSITRQALHALGMWFIHPVTGKEHKVFAELPNDMLDVWERVGGDRVTLNQRLKTAFLESGIFANIEGREELT
ncbi:RluA family pseudouridine synthase [Alicyclobacillus curvatus]|nr:RluA family pseudouridine synthase [Alicyclobacillus curvatus]